MLFIVQGSSSLFRKISFCFQWNTGLVKTSQMRQTPKWWVIKEQQTSDAKMNIYNDSLLLLPSQK